MSKTHATQKTAYTSTGIYIPVKVKFLIATAIACFWLLFSITVAMPWINDLAQVVGLPISIITITFVALVPGFLNAHLMMSIILDRPDDWVKYDGSSLPPISVLIAAYNEEDVIADTIASLRKQSYAGKVEIVVIDDGSQDRTVEVLKGIKDNSLVVVEAEHGGKAHALNAGLKHASHDILVTIDADTYLHPDALNRIVYRLITDPDNTAAVAGSVLVRNSRHNFITKLQEWDYFLAIGSVKRQQSLYQGTLVAQGAFSAYRKKPVEQAYGWPSCLGEDIVLTWALLKAGYRIGFEPTAVAFTTVPTTLKGFSRQRQRWARGMIEGLKAHIDLIWKRPQLPAFFVAVDVLFPILDSFYTFAFLPGIVLALLGYYWIAGPMTLFVIPLLAIIALVMLRRQKRVFRLLGLKIRRNYLGFIGYMVVYQMIMSPICVVGYFKEFLNLHKSW